jgi:hypothetical protein
VFASFACGSQGQELEKREGTHTVPNTTRTLSRSETSASTRFNAGAVPADRSANISAGSSQSHGRKRGDGDRKTTSADRYSCPSILDITLASPPPETTATPSGDGVLVSICSLHQSTAQDGMRLIVTEVALERINTGQCKRKTEVCRGVQMPKRCSPLLSAVALWARSQNNRVKQLDFCLVIFGVLFFLSGLLTNGT